MQRKKKIEAIIKPFRLEALQSALANIGVEQMTVSEVRGFGPQNLHAGIYRGTEYTLDSIPKIKIELLLPDDRLTETLAALRQVAQTGKSGDDKVFISTIENALDISMERLEAAATHAPILTRNSGLMPSPERPLERLKKYCSHSERGFLGFGKALAKEQV